MKLHIAPPGFTRSTTPKPRATGRANCAVRMPNSAIPFAQIDRGEWFLDAADGICCKLRLQIMDDQPANAFVFQTGKLTYIEPRAPVHPVIDPFHPQSRRQRSHFCSVCAKIRPVITID